MSGIKDQEKIEELRRRLYERGTPSVTHSGHELHDIKEDVRTSWERPPHPAQTSAPTAAPAAPIMDPNMVRSARNKRREYRYKILLAGIIFFIVAVGASSLYLMFGKSGISGNNISIAVTGPFTVGGGQPLKMQVGITNSNAVPIEAATLIVEYPQGTMSVATDTAQARPLFTERLPLETIKSGETVNVPMQAIAYGKEGDAEAVKVSIEYRVQGSNATFYKEADPLNFKISSSPVIVHADTVKKISSGQETQVTLTIISNSPTPLSEVLVKADYPTGFQYASSDPAPSRDQDEWLIENLKPESTETITLTGTVVGKESDENAINFTVGVPSDQDPSTMASIFTTAQTQFQIEQPFLNVSTRINGSTDDTVIIDPGKRSNVEVDLTNTLSDTLYDVSIQVNLSGNAYSIDQIGPSSGYFDESKNTITWDVSNTPLLHEVTPGDTERLSFTIQPAAGVSQTPQIDMSVNATANRVSENNVSQKLVGTSQSSIKVVSVPELKTVVNHNNGIFTDTGPVPPIADQTTTYTVSMVITNGSNDIRNAVVDASLPGYVTWLDKTDGSSDVTYDTTTRAIEWKAGDIPANKQTYLSFQVSLLPRSLLVNTIPVLVNTQRIQATDSFTGSVVHGTSPAVTTHLATDTDRHDSTGTVRASGSN